MSTENLYSRPDGDTDSKYLNGSKSHQEATSEHVEASGDVVVCTDYGVGHP